jgi:hypothetical protein
MKRKIIIAKLSFPGIMTRLSKLHKVRGFFSNEFIQFELMHNHEIGTDRYYYRYPAIQFKTQDSLSIFGYKPEGVSILHEIYLKTDKITLEGETISIKHKKIDVREEEFGEDGKYYKYSFSSPWLALNQKNYNEYRDLKDNQKKKQKLHTILINNIISFCKFAGYTVTEQLIVESEFYEQPAILKGKTLLAFNGEFKINFLLPDFIGLGKSSSRGYGNISKR